MTSSVHAERGIALPIAVLALVVVAALVGGAFFAGLQEARLADDVRQVVRTFGAAEAGLAEVTRTWDGRAAAALPVFAAGSLTVARRPTPFGTGWYHGSVYRLTENLYFLDVSGTAAAATSPGREAARRRLGLLVRARAPAIRGDAALTARGMVAVRDSVTIDGRDAIPNATWTACDQPGPAAAGIRVHGTVAADATGPTIDGAPPVAYDTSVTAAAFAQLGDVTYDELATRADVSLGPGAYASEAAAVGGVCDRRPTNWGDGLDRTSPCGDYMPVVHVRGDLILGAGQGQGVLLVDGDLEVRGPFHYVGVVLVRGSLRVLDTGTGPSRFFGAVLAGNGGNAASTLAGGVLVWFSKCAIQHVLRAASFVGPVRSRGWAQLF